MIANRNHFITARARAGLISLTTVSYIEEHRLLDPAQLDDAKQSLQASFLCTSGEESALRKLVAMLQTTRRIHRAFARISGTVAGVFQCYGVVEGKLDALRTALAREPVTADANAAFVGPFLSFSHAFLQQTLAFADSLAQYLAAREQEARAQDYRRMARAARERARRPPHDSLGEAGAELQTRITDEIMAAVDHDETEVGLANARYQSRVAERTVKDHLWEIRSMCRRAMNPALRDRHAIVAPEADVYACFARTLPAQACLAPLEDSVLELFKLYQHAYGVFQLDYQKLESALATMMDNPDAYFQSKAEDRHATTRQDKLRKIDALVRFLEQTAGLAADEHMDAYPTFTRELSAAICERRAPWRPIAEDLLRAKVRAEAEVSARL